MNWPLATLPVGAEWRAPLQWGDGRGRGFGSRRPCAHAVPRFPAMDRVNHAFAMERFARKPASLRGRVFSAFDLIWQAMRLASLVLGGLLADSGSAPCTTWVGRCSSLRPSPA